jgi:UDP-N-acetylmuramoyl-L-alanyl-D-glutamate--2,6-diaminopimelate ligase
VTAPLGDLAAAGGDVVLAVAGDPATPITGLAYDWRCVPAGHMFCCIETVVDGHRLAASAIESGAVALCVESATGLGVPEIVVSDARTAMARMATAFYGRPADELDLLAVTGTNGKTTTSLLLESILRADGRSTGVIGSLWWRIGDDERSSAWTTPEAPVLHWLLADMRAHGVRSVVMEVTSHGLRLKRVEGLRFASAVFTNLSHDHLDFHTDMDDYFAAKRSLFVAERAARGAINVDDRYGRVLKEEAEIPCLGFGMSADADVRADNISVGRSGSAFRIATPCGAVDVTTPLVGSFNVYNCLAAATGALQANVALEAIAAGIAAVSDVPGRFEQISLGQPFSVVVDYAHTPHSLEVVLKTARLFASAEGRVICVFGCGGGRDRSKRALMGALAGRLADLVVVTSDNPRFDDPAVLVADVLAGVLSERICEDDAILPDRREAIAHALATARAGDVVVIAGKGAEQSQQVRGRNIPFDDRVVVRTVLNELGWDTEA